MNKTKRNTILLSAVVLRIFVAATFIALASRLNLFLQDADGAISLTGEETQVSFAVPAGEIVSDIEYMQNTAPQGAGSAIGAVVNPLTLTGESALAPQLSTLQFTETVQPKNMYNPGFKAEDDRQVWTTETQIDIFKVTYENGNGEITVASDNGEKVFAPGTDNSYTFKLINTGDVTLAYDLELRAYYTPDTIDLPIDARLNRYDGYWLTPDTGEYVDVLTLNGLTDADKLGAGKYTYYTIDWRWLFESGHDDVDTMLGNMAVDQDLTLTIEILTTATATEEPGGGITVPDTGDNTNTILWLCLCFGSALLIILLLYYRKSIKEEEEAEKR